MELVEFLVFLITLVLMVILAIRRAKASKKTREELEEAGAEELEQEEALREFLRSMNIEVEERLNPKIEVEERLNPKPAMQEPQSPPPIAKEKPISTLPPPFVETPREFFSFFEEDSEESAYQLPKKAGASRVARLLRALPSSQEMVILAEVIQKPKGLNES